MANKKYFKEQCKKAVEDDFKLYQKNARDVAFSNGTLDGDLLKRLRFASRAFDAKYIQDMVRQYGHEIQLLSLPNVTVRSIVDAFKLYQDEKLSTDHLMSKTDSVVGLGLIKKNMLNEFSILNHEFLPSND